VAVKAKAKAKAEAEATARSAEQTASEGTRRGYGAARWKRRGKGREKVVLGSAYLP
jgi:hypothetical protein